MSDPLLDYHPTRARAIASLTAKAKELIETRDPIELFDIKGLPKPVVPMGDGMFARSAIAILHELGIDQARDPDEWREYLHQEFPVRRQILANRRMERKRLLENALRSPVVSLRQGKAIKNELQSIADEDTGDILEARAA